MNGLNRLIAMGGTQIASPVQRYQQTRKDMQTEDMNRLSMMSTQQQMGINKQVNERAKQAADIKIIAPHAKSILEIQDPTKREAAYQQSLIQIEQQGVDITKAPPKWDDNTGKALMQAGGLKMDETFSPVIEDGSVVAQKSDVSGRVYKDPRAPEKTEVGTPGEFTAGSKSNRFKLNEKRRVAEMSAMRAVKGNNELLKLIDDPNWVGGTAGDVISIANSLSQQMANLSGVKQRGYKNVPDKDVSAETRSQFSALRKKARAGDRYAAAKIEMAYVNAKRVDPASKITDKDFAFADKMLGSGGDKAIIKEILMDGSNRAIDTYNDAEDITGSRNSWYEEKRISDDRRNELLGTGSPMAQPASIQPPQGFDPDAWLLEAEKQ